ncbi:hypothetical protein KFL_003490060 [Klebsormidium nitens]|uniref:RRM domain-containing protein n=1 Tax=Klebsormidium nitens TaxID=105231 RepID=A0A1Y1IBN6_KLENI|nr:hypothetical protein KFL_003490060 [Klebsormidium nitens]|eukprot:GAQ87382.1 hypothetical protein KFL_003490060 [Klebsormidium nitens]
MDEEQEAYAEHHEEEEEEDSDVDVEDDGNDEHENNNEEEEGEGGDGMQDHDDQEDHEANEENEDEELEEEGGEGEEEEEQDLVVGEGEDNDGEGEGEGEGTNMEADGDEGEDHEGEGAQAETEAAETAEAAKEGGEHHKEEGKKWDGDADKDPMKLPPHGTEVFVGGIPQGTTEDELKEAFSSAGEVFAVRIARDPQDQTPRGFAFVTYREREAAAKAVTDFQSLEIKGKSVRVNNSQSKHRLFVGGIPRDLTKETLREHLEEVTLGAESIDVPTNPQNPSQNRGFLFIDFYNHAAAEHSRRKMIRQDFRLGGRQVTISWAEAKSSETSASELAQVKVLYVKGLPESATDEKLRELFVKYGEIERAVIPPPKPGQPPRNFGFVHFVDRKAAIAAMEKDQKHEMEGNELEVSLARPPPERQPRASQGAQMATAFAGISYQQPYGGYVAPARGANAYGAYGTAYSGGSSRRGGQTQVQPAMPFIQAPAGMTMVPMQLPDGQVGYILQQAGGAGAGTGPVRGGRQASSSYGSTSGSGQSGRRFHPYN